MEKFTGDGTKAPDGRKLMEEVMLVHGWNRDKLADHIAKKRRTIDGIMRGELPLAADLERHLQLLLENARLRRPSLGTNSSSALVNEEISYSSDPRSAVKRRREEMKLSHEQLAQMSKVPAQYIRDIEAGTVQGSNEKQIRKLAAALNLDPELLLSGSDHPPTIGDHIVAFGATPDVKLTDNITAKTIPLISMAQAGELIEFDDVYDYEGVVAYAGKDPRAIAVRIRGESMMPTYEPGTIAIVYPSFKPKNDNLVVAKVRDGSVLFKRLQIRESEAVFHSINPNWPPMTYAERDIVWMYPVGLTQKVEL